MGPQPPPQALRFSHGRGERETRVTGDEPQGTMGRVQTPSRLPLRAHRKRDVWVRGRWALYLLIMATTMPPITIIVHCNTSVKKTAVRPPTKKCLSYLQAWEVLRSKRVSVKRGLRSSSEVQMNHSTIKNRWSIREVQMMFRGSTNEVQMMYKWSRNDVQMTYKWRTNEVQMMYKWSRNDVQMTYK